MKRIENNIGEAVIINELALHYSYDVMTQLAFGESGGFADGSSSDTANEVLNGIHEGAYAIGLLCHNLLDYDTVDDICRSRGPYEAFQ